MKQIIIFLLVIIVGVMGFNLFENYERFSLDNYGYQALEIEITKENKSDLLDYYKAIENVNGYVITQWSVNEIDVRNPENDKEVTVHAVNMYRSKLADVKYYEALLQNPVKRVEPKNEFSKRKKLLKGLLNNNDDLRIGRSNAAVFELQKLLVSHGYDIPIDGVFKKITLETIKDFQEKNKLFPDGKTDALTINTLLE